MSEKRTRVVAGPSGYLFYGHIKRAEAVAECRRVWERKLREARLVLAALDAGTEQVFHQRGVYRISQLRELAKDGER